MTSPVYASGKTQVAIFGAGIAGLTAAHELVERGFQVDVYETEPPSVVEQAGFPHLDPHAECGVGGMARTQWASVERYLGDAQDVAGKPDPPPDNQEMVSTRLPGVVVNNARVLGFHDLRFGANDVAPSQDLLDTIAKIAKILVRNKIRAVEVRGFTDELGADPYPDATIGKKRKDWQRAENVANALMKCAPDTRIFWAAFGTGRRDDWACADADRNYVSIHIIDDWLPGEHGFRFFPAFYRHVFDTMRRTPIPDPIEGYYREGGRTVLDNVLPTTYFGLSTEHEPLLRFQRRPPASLRDFFDQFEGLLNAAGYTIGDLARYQRMILKFMTSCPDRRAAEYQAMSWAEFVDIGQFSENFQRYLDATAHVLVGLQASRCDARTYGNITVQMLQDQVAPSSRTDGTLNGPTSEAWFHPWRQYLEAQGVRFHRGTLQGFVFHEDSGEVEPWPVVDLPQYVPSPSGDTLQAKRTVLVRDYYVLALPALELQRLALAHPELRGEDFDRLRAFSLGDPKQAEPGGALDHMSGIQYFLDSDFTFLNGHIIFPDTEWKLSAISQPQFWMRKRGWWSGYRGILSVDISDFHSSGDKAPGPAWGKTKREIAKTVWDTIVANVEPAVISEWKRSGGAYVDGQECHLIPAPRYYHLDDHLVDASGQPIQETGRPENDKSPYLVCRAGEYPKRPGSPGEYTMHLGRVVLAGTLVQTHTRLTTMEAANESARHAVNAILQASKFCGERCAIWDPERNELADLKFLVEVDQELFEQGLPHCFDILDIREVPPELLRAEPESAMRDLVAQALARGVRSSAS